METGIQGEDDLKNNVFRIMFLLCVFSSSLLILYHPQKSEQQETPQYFAQTMKTVDNCPITRLYASRMYVPIMIKEFHDPTPNWQVSSISMTNSTKSVANLDGTNKYSFLISTNDTDQFDFRTVASDTLLYGSLK